MSGIPPEPTREDSADHRQDEASSLPEQLVTTKEERTWAMLCHLSSLLLYVGIPFANIVAPLVIWVLKKDQSAFIDDQGKEVINFQLSLLIYIIVSVLLVIVFVGFVLLAILAIFHVVFAIIGGIKAYDGEAYRYPLTIRFL